MSTKYAMIIPDGAADEPIDELGGRTALEAADTPNMDAVSIQGRQGLVRTVPNDMEPGSDIAQMSLLGYDPHRYYTGRAPREAVARDIKLSADDWVFRCNLVTIVDGKMEDHSAGHISTEEAGRLIEELNEHLGSEGVRFYAGVGYRHLVVFRGADFSVQTYPPHDNIGTAKERILPRGKGAEILVDLMARSGQLFWEHEINRVRKDLGENQVSSIWLWGQGKRTIMERFEKRFGIKGVSIAAVDLVRGLSKLTGFELINVAGATGFVDTNYAGKGSAAVEALDKYDLVLVHIESPDEASHSGSARLKQKAIEQIDRHVVGPVFERLKQFKSWRIIVVPDHPTPVCSRSHSAEPVPFAMAGTGVSSILHRSFSEANARQSGFRIDNGYELMEYFLRS